MQIVKCDRDQAVHLSISLFDVGVDTYVLNTEDFGYLMKPSDHTHSSLQEQADSFINYKLKTLG